MDFSTPTPITCLLSSRSLCTSGVKSLSPVQRTKVEMYPRSKANSIASTAILMSAAFLRVAPIRCGISISSTCERVNIRRSSSKYDQSAYARRTTTRPRSASASAIGRKSNIAPPWWSRTPSARFS